MSYVKYGEDDKKITESRRFMLHGSEFSQKKREPVHYYDCKYCSQIFTERQKLFLHIKQQHNIVRPLVVINEKVVSDHCVIHFLDSAVIDLFGYEGTILLNKNPVYAGYSEEIDITHILARELSADSHCRISFQEATIDIDLVGYSIHDRDDVTAVLEQWEKEIASNQRLSLPDLSLLDDGSRIFLNGVYNYYIGSRAHKDKAKRYDDALASLSNFNHLDGIGLCVMKIIAFRRNWIARLEMLTDDQIDIFSVASDFFHLRRSYVTAFSGEKQIYIEDSTMKSLNLILLFQRGEYNQLRKLLEAIPEIDILRDQNFGDQINLLRARLAVLDSDKRNAEYYYEKLAAPAFREEYAQYKKGALQPLR